MAMVYALSVALAIVLGEAAVQIRKTGKITSVASLNGGGGSIIRKTKIAMPSKEPYGIIPENVAAHMMRRKVGLTPRANSSEVGFETAFEVTSNGDLSEMQPVKNAVQVTSMIMGRPEDK